MTCKEGFQRGAQQPDLNNEESVPSRRRLPQVRVAAWEVQYQLPLTPSAVRRTVLLKIVLIFRPSTFVPCLAEGAGVPIFG